MHISFWSVQEEKKRVVKLLPRKRRKKPPTNTMMQMKTLHPKTILKPNRHRWAANSVFESSSVNNVSRTADGACMCIRAHGHCRNNQCLLTHLALRHKRFRLRNLAEPLLLLLQRDQHLHQSS